MSARPTQDFTAFFPNLSYFFWGKVVAVEVDSVGLDGEGYVCAGVE